MASSSTASSWMPSQGRHPVNIGSSLGRAIKNRKLKGSPAPTTKRSNLPERDFYSFKFNFKASSIDATKPASIEIKKGAENSQVLAEYPSTQSGEAHSFVGIEQTAKDVDCILIYDEDTGQYTLEKLDSFVLLKFNRKLAVSPRPASPAPIPTSSSNKGKAKQEYDNIEREISGVDEDAEGEADDLEELLNQAVAYRREEEEEEEEGEEVEVPRKPVVPPKPQPPPPKAARPVKPMPKPRVEVKVPPVAPQPPPTKAQPPPPAVTASAAAPAPAPPKAKPAQPKTKKAKPAAPPSTSYPDEEVIEFGKPAKRARPSPPQQPPPAPTPAAPVSLSLPGGSTPSFAPPPAPVSSKPSASTSRNVPAPAPPLAVAPSSPQMVQSDSSDDEEDWEQVPTAIPVISQPQPDYELALEEDIFGDGFADADAEGGEEIDVNAFEQELNEQMGESDDDFLAAAVSPEPEQQQTRQPISLNRLASGADAADSEDDYTSSEDSDED